ncbi:Activity-regulated cytoskeleton associated protein 1, partial [Bienertia sinuspersici]
PLVPGCGHIVSIGGTRPHQGMGMTRAMTYKDPVAKVGNNHALMHGTATRSIAARIARAVSLRALMGSAHVSLGWVPGFPETCAGPMLCVDGLLRARPYVRGWWVLVWFDERGCVRWWVVAAMADTMRALVMGYVPLGEARQCLGKATANGSVGITKGHHCGSMGNEAAQASWQRERAVSGICFMPPKQKFHKIKKPVAPYLREIRRVTKEKKRDSLAFREGQLDLVGIMAPMSKHRIRRIEKFLGIRKEGALPIHSVRDTLDALNGQVQEMNHMIQRILDRPSMESPQGSNSVSQDLEILREEVTILRRAMNGENSPTSGVERMKLPEPKSFDGNRDSKVLENFIWDLEHYFKVGKRRDGCKVDIAALYLSGDAKLWWRSRLDADKAMGRNPISTWEEMKVELRKQFLPNNVSWVARDKLRELRHTGSIREYVKQFMSLMLDIDGMSEQDKLYTFIAGLKPWAQTELRRQKVEDLTSAIAAAEALVDWKPRNENTDKGKEKANDKGKKRKFGKFKGSDKKFKRWNKEDSSSKTDKRDEASTSKKPKFEGGCFICKGPHLARQCPKRQQLSAILSEENNGEGAHDGGDTPPRINNMRLLNAMNTEDAGIDGLMYCKVRLDGKDLMAMFDTGASHNFIKESVARKAMTYKDPVAKVGNNHALMHGTATRSIAARIARAVSLRALMGAMASQAVRFHCQDQGWVPGFPETCAGPMLCVDGLLRARPYVRGWWVLVWFDERGCVRWWVVAAMADTMRALVMGYVPLGEARQCLGKATANGSVGITKGHHCGSMGNEAAQASWQRGTY